MRYILNSAVITAPGRYDYWLIDEHQAQAWLEQGPWTSTIGYEETAHALSLITNLNIPVYRTIIRMKPGDEALVFRVTLPPGERRLAVQQKGREGIEFILRNCEIGILRRIDEG